MDWWWDRKRRGALLVVLASAILVRLRSPFDPTMWKHVSLHTKQQFVIVSHPHTSTRGYTRLQTVQSVVQQLEIVKSLAFGVRYHTVSDISGVFPRYSIPYDNSIRYSIPVQVVHDGIPQSNYSVLYCRLAEACDFWLVIFMSHLTFDNGIYRRFGLCVRVFVSLSFISEEDVFTAPAYCPIAINKSVAPGHFFL